MEVCIPFLIIIGAVIVLIAPIFIVAGVSSARRKKFRQMIIETKQDILRRGKYFPVRYASSKKYHSFFKFFPWETSGVIYADEREIIFFAAKIKGEQNVELHFRRGDFTVEYVGTENFFTNGFVTWFCIKTYEDKHYFTSETGATIFGSGTSTRDIYNGLLEAVEPHQQ
ncbi:hypothetical protein GF359_03330 [candidate division WOR-3 bacterium]|uniref:Uncharacterized protein n=1 Tax=candidate division WOR-3 bacterium TaxID=2052148 RepID=A0A9D5QCN2_UNCW3|nr:hypothetical protein [candidate division WOR-3 bacterium]MBD3364227.1 hypothetical protein [candidate division WOR-3 bacterium]